VIIFSNRQGETRSQRRYFDPITRRCQIGFSLVNPPARAYLLGMKNLTAAIIGVLLIALGVMYWIQHQSMERLRADIATLAQQNDSLKADAENLSQQLMQTTNSQAAAKAQLSELLKLRGEVGQLRRQSGELAKMKQQLQTAPAPAAAPAALPNTLTPEEQSKLVEFHTANAIKQLGLAARLYAGDNNNQYPTNFAQLKDDLAGVTNFAGNISLDSIEFVNAGLVNEAMPEMIIFRERIPRLLPPNGPWQRVYGLADGSAQTIYSPTENFDEYEKPRLVPPPQN